ncbi:MAG: FKBP-type peptidyl-prolyl cis-trans isomerase [Fimbriimonas sp.]
MRKALWSMLPALLVLIGCNGDTAPKPTPEATNPTTSGAGATGTPTAATGTTPATSPTAGLKKLEVKETKKGKGSPAALGDTLWVTYVGKFMNGTVFDSSERSGGQPLVLTLGAGQVIEGWEKGLEGATTGSSRDIKIPYKMAYGENGKEPKIPPRSDLQFSVDVLAVVKQGEEGLVDATDLKKGTGPEVKKGSTVTINFRGTLVTGVEFDSTKKLGKPFTFKVGNKETLEGIDVGILGMKKGGKRRLFVPPKLGLPFGNETVPPNNPLIIEIEVVDVK